MRKRLSLKICTLDTGWRDKYHHYSQPQQKPSSRYPETVTSVTPKVNWRLILSALLQV